MKIIDKRTPMVPFKEIKAGECFFDGDNELNIKIAAFHYDTGVNRPNAVVLDRGLPWMCDEEYQVIKANAQVIIEG